MSWRRSVFHITWQLWWRQEGKRGFCWDSCKYVFSLRYCHAGIADLQWVVVSQGWKINIYFVISFPTWQILEQMQAYFCFQLTKKQTEKYDWCLRLISLAFLPLFLSLCKSLIRFGTEYWDMSIRYFEYWVRSMQGHHLNLCIIFIIIIFIAPSHKENSIVMAYRSPKTFFSVYLVHCLCNIFFLVLFIFFVMYCLTLIHR